MRKLLTMALMLLFAASIASAEKPMLKRYLIESGKVEYKMEGNNEGTKTMYWDDWGRKEAKITNAEMSFMGFTTTQKQLEILEGFWQYTINLENNTGTKMKNTMLQNMSDNYKGDNMGEMGEEMLIQMGGEKTGTGTILGKNCDIWEISIMGGNTKIWVWNYVPLKLESSALGTDIREEAISIETNISVPAGTFEVPADATISEVEMPNNNKKKKKEEEDGNMLKKMFKGFGK